MSKPAPNQMPYLIRINFNILYDFYIFSCKVLLNLYRQQNDAEKTSKGPNDSKVEEAKC